MVRQGRPIAVVRAFVIGCAFLLAVGYSGTRSEAPKKQQQEHTEVTNTEQTRSPEATDSEEGARCDRTRTIETWKVIEAPRRGLNERDLLTTNDIPGCPKGGLLSGTDKTDKLYGGDGDDEICGLGAKDYLFGGVGNDVFYAGPGDDTLGARSGEDVLYGGVFGGGKDGQRDEIYCGKGKDAYIIDKKDFVSSSCEKKEVPVGGAA